MYQDETINYSQKDDELLVNGNSRLLEFQQDALRRISPSYLIWVLLSVAISLGVYLVYKTNPHSSIVPSLSIYYGFVAIHIVHRLKGGGKANILSPDLLYIALYTLFHLGYVTLYALDCVEYSSYVFYYDFSIPKALFVVNLGLLGFIFGYEILSPWTEVNADIFTLRVPKISWSIIGIVLMAVAMLMHFMALSTVGMTLIKTHGYTVLQNARQYTTYFWTLMLTQSISLMAFGLVMYMLSSAFRTGKLFSSKLPLIMFLVFISIVALEGNRTEVLIFAIPVILIRHYFVKRIKIRYLICIAVAALVLFAAIGVARNIAMDPTQMWKEYQYKKESAEVDWTTSIVEMGGSFLVMSITCGDVPQQEPYWLGASWRDSAIHFVPFLQRVAIKSGISTWAPSEWITVSYFGIDAAGRGFTVAAEGYLNFGFAGAFLELMFFGFFIRWLSARFSRNPSVMWGLIFLGCMGPLLTVIRNHMNLVTNIITQVLIIAFLLNFLLGNEPFVEEKEWTVENE